MADKQFDSVLVKQCRLQCDGRNWDLPGAFDATDASAVAVRTILELAGEVDLLANTPEAREERLAMVNALKPIFEAGAPVNFRRTALVQMGIAPKMATAEKKAETRVI